MDEQPPLSDAHRNNGDNTSATQTSDNVSSDDKEQIILLFYLFIH